MTTIQRRRLGLTVEGVKSAGGYTLFAPQTGDGVVQLINIYGDIVHAWALPVRPGRDAVLLPNGNLGYNGSHAKSAELYPAWDIWHGGHFMEAEPSGHIVWEHEDIYHHHDAQWLENGNLLYTVASPLPPKKSTLLSNIAKQSDIVKEVNRKGEVVWEWKAWEHLDPNEWPIHECFNNDHWPMINGVHQHGNFVYLSLRTTSGIIKVNKETKNIEWEFKYPRVAQQHDPSITHDGTLICFDNGNIRPSSIHHSRIVEYDIDAQEMVWVYKDDMPPAFFSPYMGSVQRLWNDNTMICESAFGRIFEVTFEGEIVWEYVIPDFAEYPAPLNKFITGSHNSCFKAHRYREVEWL